MYWLQKNIWLLLFTLNLFDLVDSLLLKKIFEQQLKYGIPRAGGVHCSIKDVDLKRETLDCGDTTDLVSHGTQCALTDLGGTTVLSCVNGQWKVSGDETGDGVSLQRIKRDGQLAGAIDIDSCVYFCGKTDELNTGKRQPPRFTNCPLEDQQAIYYTDSGERSTLVTWTLPTAKDSAGNTLNITQLSVPVNGGRFEGSIIGHQYKILYKAVDRDGLKEFCQFYITVKVRSCPVLPWPDNGFIDCSKENIFGSTCNFTCREGYEMTDNSTVSCKADGNWTGDPTCSKIICPEPVNVASGSITCNDRNHTYQSVCTYRCNKGFALQGPIFTECQANKTWSHVGEQTCLDIEPPVLECVSPQLFYADESLHSSSLTWLKPTAIDNVDLNPTVTQIEGPSLGDVIPTGITRLLYRATDGSGNASPNCSIELKVLEITCQHPRKTFDDSNLIFKCSESSLYYGVYCNLSCDYNLPLEGATTVTCDKNVTLDGTAFGSWNWGTAPQPYCREMNCPALDAPVNGYLRYESVHSNPVNIVVCNETYALPDLPPFHGQLYCVQGFWTPFNKTPDCIEPQTPSRMNLHAKLHYYYTESCSEVGLKQNLLAVISDTIDPWYTAICPNQIKCSVDGLTVNCGQTRKKRNAAISVGTEQVFGTIRVKRQETYHALIQFDILTEWFQGNMSDNEAVDYMDGLQLELKDAFATLVGNGSLNIDGYTLESNSFQSDTYGEIECGHGTKLDGLLCKPCPRGMYLDEILSKCELCPIGQFHDTDGNTTCKLCPEGYSTLQKGSKLPQDCIKLCDAGYASLTSMEPCTICPVGYYQGPGGMSCTQCPKGLTTTLPGSTNVTLCQSFDVLLHGALRNVTLGSINCSRNLSMIVWVKQLKRKSTGHTTLKLISGQEDILAISFSSTISILSFDTGVLLSAESWVHIAVVITDESLIAFIDGQVTINETVDRPLQNSGHFVLSQTDSDGIFLSGLQITNQYLTVKDILPLLTTCKELVEETLISMDAFLGITHSNIVTITPPVCDAVDDCTSFPCGEHQCFNEMNGFRCECSNGMTGRSCDTPPDYCKQNKCENGAPCQSHRTNYTCKCGTGYSGIHCENVPVNGGWSVYREWSACSVSCNGGVRIRKRTCDRPPRGEGLLDCIGSSEESEPCNVGPCRECDMPAETQGITLNCTTDENSDLINCYQTCSEGMVLISEFKQTGYRCGSKTNYEWAPVHIFPSCVSVTKPDSYMIDISGSYDSVIPHPSTPIAESKIKENMSIIDCMTTGKCETTVNLVNDLDLVTTVKITITVSLKLSGELDIGGYLSSGVASTSLQEVLDAIIILEQAATTMDENMSAVLDVTIDSQSYTINRSTVSISPLTGCPGGSVPAEAFCAVCPAGTKAESAVCVFCKIGTYQDEIGQTECKPCPSGFTSANIGASNRTECAEPVEATHTSNTLSTVSTSTVSIATSTTKAMPSTTKTSSAVLTTSRSISDATLTGATPNTPFKSSEKAITMSTISVHSDNTPTVGIETLFGAGTGGLALVLSLVAIAVVFYRSRRRKRNRPRVTTGFSSDNLYVDPTDIASAISYGGNRNTTKALKEVSPPLSYSVVTPQENPYLHAVTSFTSFDSNTEYLTPATSLKENRDSKFDDTYLHAMTSSSPSTKIDENDTYEGYASIPLKRDDN